MPTAIFALGMCPLGVDGYTVLSTVATCRPERRKRGVSVGCSAPVADVAAEEEPIVDRRLMVKMSLATGSGRMDLTGGMNDTAKTSAYKYTGCWNTGLNLAIRANIINIQVVYYIFNQSRFG